MGRYLITFVQRHPDFRLPELDALLKMNNLDKANVYSEKDYNSQLPYLIVNFSSEAEAIAICLRGVLIKSIMELWVSTTSYDLMRKEIQELIDKDEKNNNLFLLPYKNVSWSITVGAFGKSLSLQKQGEIRSNFKELPFDGDVKCKDPDQLFWCIEQHQPSIDGVPIKSNSIPDLIYFGREIARSNSRKFVTTYDLKKRIYLGPTSMDNELSLVMANMGLVKKNSLVLDPFVGTGSILIACSVFGALCFGTDIDTRVLKGKNGNNMFTNFDQYKLPHPEIIRCDASMYHRQFHHYHQDKEEAEGQGGERGGGQKKSKILYDAIVCDPPYGIRAGARKSGSKKEEIRPVTAELRSSHIPQTQPYAVEDVLTDLLDLSAQSLKLWGRVVFLLPTTYDFTEEDLPKHPCLQVVANSEQPLNQKMGRRLVTMEKCGHYDSSLKAVYTSIASESASRPFSQLREKMMDDSLCGSLDRREAKRRKGMKPESQPAAAAEQEEQQKEEEE